MNLTALMRHPAFMHREAREAPQINLVASLCAAGCQAAVSPLPGWDRLQKTTRLPFSARPPNPSSRERHPQQLCQQSSPTQHARVLRDGPETALAAAFAELASFAGSNPHASHRTRAALVTPEAAPAMLQQSSKSLSASRSPRFAQFGLAGCLPIFPSVWMTPCPLRSWLSHLPRAQVPSNNGFRQAACQPTNICRHCFFSNKCLDEIGDKCIKKT